MKTLLRTRLIRKVVPEVLVSLYKKILYQILLLRTAFYNLAFTLTARTFTTTSR